MVKLKKILLSFHFLFSNIVLAQIAGVINSYSGISNIGSGKDFATVDNASKFKIGERVLIIQMQGVSVNTSNNASYGDISSYNEAGNFEFSTISNIQGSNIYFNDLLINSYNVLGKVQMVSVPRYKDVVVQGTLTSEPWDGTIGGVLVLEATCSITLEADINVDGKGYKGGKPNIDDIIGTGSGNCTNSLTFASNTYLAASKGDGVAVPISGAENGRGKLANAGGGGNWNNAGGGGGGGYGSGGQGGNSSKCLISPQNGLGGISVNNQGINKLFMGGGGGGGHQNNFDNGAGPPSRPGSTPGGAGGGIIIIRTSVLDAQNHTISAQGLSSGIIYSFGDGAGGGGAGGAIVLQANNILTGLNINLNGGKGDDVYDETMRDLGPGGGGGGGLLWVNGSLPTTVSVEANGGQPGVTLATSPCLCSNGATKGGDGGTRTDLAITETEPFVAACGLSNELFVFGITSLGHERTNIEYQILGLETYKYLTYRKIGSGEFNLIDTFSPQKNNLAERSIIDDLSAIELDNSIVYYRLIKVGAKGENVLAEKSILLESQNKSGETKIFVDSKSGKICFLDDFLPEKLELYNPSGGIIGIFDKNDFEQTYCFVFNNFELNGSYFLKLYFSDFVEVKKIMALSGR